MTHTDRADVVVVGAGIAGASAAWALGRDLDVILLELESQPGKHATGRSAAVITETYGLRQVCTLARASRPFLTRPDPDVSESCLLSPRGLLWVADIASTDALGELAAMADSIGTTIEPLDLASACKMVPVLRPNWVEAAFYEPDAMSIDVAALLGGFVAAFRRAGGTIRLATPALRLEPRATSWSVITADRTIECSSVVNAAGAWSDDVAVRAGIEPLGLTPLLRTAFTFPVDDANDWPLVMDAGGGFYFEPEGPGLLVSPADETPSEPCDARAEEVAIAIATDALFGATTLRVRGVRSAWAGLRTFAPDRLPVVGEDPSAPGFYWLAGQGGAGIKTAPALAQMIASLVRHEPLSSDLLECGVDTAELSPARFR